jgi:hypothetical protein
MSLTLDDFEDYPELTGSLYDSKYSQPFWDNEEDHDKRELYYKKVYKDVYDDKIINYQEKDYMNIVSNIIDSSIDGKHTHIINRIKDILEFKKHHNLIIFNKLQTHLINMINKHPGCVDHPGIYVSHDGTKSIMFLPCLERQSKWRSDIHVHEFTELFSIVRNVLRRKYSCKYMLMDSLYNDLIKTNGSILKIELTVRNARISNSVTYRALVVMLEVYKLSQVRAVKLMALTEKEMNELNYCWNGETVLRQWVPYNYKYRITTATN